MGCAPIRINVGVFQVLVVVALVVLPFGGRRLGSASDPAWVQPAAEVAKAAQQVRQVTWLPRRFPFR